MRARIAAYKAKLQTQTDKRWVRATLDVWSVASWFRDQAARAVTWAVKYGVAVPVALLIITGTSAAFAYNAGFDAETDKCFVD
jgi:hypothetical protein